MTLRALVAGGVLAAAAGCGGDALLTATFTSRVVQLETCRTLGEGDEGCEEDEQFSELRLDLVQVDDVTFWLYGVPRGGVDDRALLGTRDSAGGFLFFDETSQQNTASGCVLRSSIELSVQIDPARVDDVGDPCVSLVGRQVDRTTSSAECDTAVPPQAVERVVRKRWEPLAESSRCGE